jgi:hypothetical protein
MIGHSGNFTFLYPEETESALILGNTIPGTYKVFHKECTEF